jgi:GTP-binding protein
MQKNHPPMLEGGKRLRIFYLAQVDVQPPRFVLFVNNPQLMADTYKKYLINQFRAEYGFAGAPIKFFLKGRAVQDKSAVPLKPLEEIEELVFSQE